MHVFFFWQHSTGFNVLGTWQQVLAAIAQVPVRQKKKSHSMAVKEPYYDGK
jgi:hypothetical protein